MKSKLLLSLSLFIISPSLVAQDWVPLGATWYNHVSKFASQNFAVAKLTYDRDSMVNGRQAQVIKRENYGWICNGLGETNQLILSYENNQLHYYHHEQHVFYLMIDFNTEAGESWTIPVFNSIVDSLNVMVDSTSYYALDNQDSLKAQHVRVFSYSPHGTEFYDTEVIEKIGFLTGLYPDTYHSSSL